VQVNAIVIFITSPTLEEAENISKALVEAKKAACCNILKDVDSVFFWKDKLQKEKEVLVIVKSTEDKFKSITKIIKKFHSYDTPEIIALPVKMVDKKYKDWMREVLK
jgi:periplasmic divalent cation tolerance protein